MFGTGTVVSGTSSAETLTVTVDGTDVAVVLNTNFTNVATAASGITIAGATIAVAEGGSSWTPPGGDLVETVLGITCSNITFIGQGIGETTIFGGIAICSVQNITLKQLKSIPSTLISLSRPRPVNKLPV